MAQTLACLRWQLAWYAARREVVTSHVLGREDRVALA